MSSAGEFKGGPYVVERHDQEDGSITFEIWDHRPDSYRRLCSINEDCESLTFSDDGARPPATAKTDAEMIARGLNDLVARGAERIPRRVRKAVRA